MTDREWEVSVCTDTYGARDGPASAEIDMAGCIAMAEINTLPKR